MGNSWIPTPVAVMWCVLFAMILLLHLWHAVVMSLRHRIWHLGHCMMAAGMIAMFWPTPVMALPVGVGVALFAVAALGLAAGLAIAGARGVGVGWLWLVSVADLGWMVYMFAMMSSRWIWLSILGAGWFAVQALAWASGRLGRVLAGYGLGELIPATHSTLLSASSDAGGDHGVASQRSNEYLPVLAGAAHGFVPGSVVGGGDEHAPASTVPRRVIDGGPRDYSVRISLTVMGLGMSYMLLAMQFGMAAMSGMGAM